MSFQKSFQSCWFVFRNGSSAAPGHPSNQVVGVGPPEPSEFTEFICSCDAIFFLKTLIQATKCAAFGKPPPCGKAGDYPPPYTPGVRPSPAIPEGIAKAGAVTSVIGVIGVGPAQRPEFIG